MTDTEKWARAALVALVTNLKPAAREEILSDINPLDRGRVARAIEDLKTERETR